MDMAKQIKTTEMEKLKSLLYLLNSDEFKNNEKFKKLLLQMYISNQIETKIQDSIINNLFLPFSNSDLTHYDLKRMLRVFCV